MIFNSFNSLKSNFLREMADLKNDEKCFTFTWTLENASYCWQQKTKPIRSPAFIVDEIHKTKWRLSLYPRGNNNGNYIACHLHRDCDCTGEKSMEVKSQLAFIDEIGLNLKSIDLGQQAFLKGGGWGFSEFLKREKVFILERSKFLPKDTLRIRCRIWKETGGMAENVRCFARTRIGVEKRSFVWKLENFSSLEPEEYTYVIKSLNTNKKLMSVDLSVAGGQNCEEIIRFKLTCCDEDIKYCVLRLFLVDIHGGKKECNQDEFFIEKSDDAHWFNFLFPRQKLTEKKSLYLPNDVLSLYWEWVFSKGIMSEEIEQVQYGYAAPEQELPALKKE